MRAPDGAELDVVDTALAARLAPGARAIKLDRGAFDTSPISLLSRQSVAGVAALVGNELDIGRFRANIVLDADGACADADFLDRWQRDHSVSLAELDEHWSSDARHRRVDLPLQLTRVLSKQLLPVPQDDLRADVLASELPRAKRLGHVLESHALLKRCEPIGKAVAFEDRLRRRMSSAIGRISTAPSTLTRPRTG